MQKKQISIKYVREYPQRENGYMFSTLDTMDNILLSSYMISHSTIGIVQLWSTHIKKNLWENDPIVIHV